MGLMVFVAKPYGQIPSVVADKKLRVTLRDVQITNRLLVAVKVLKAAGGQIETRYVSNNISR